VVKIKVNSPVPIKREQGKTVSLKNKTIGKRKASIVRASSLKKIKKVK